jgi:hypothetical protein
MLKMQLAPVFWRQSFTTLICKALYSETHSSYFSDDIIRVLVHAPFGGKEAREGTWRALVEAQREGKVRSIGVSNFGVHHLDELEAYINTGVGGHIDIGQYEIHPWCPRDDIVGWLQKRGVVIEAYSPLVRAKRMNEPVLDSLAKKYNKTPAQILVRWSLQKVCSAAE